jgi:hypothetical protein
MGRPFKYHTEEEKRIGRNLRERKRKYKNWSKFQELSKEYYEKNKEKIKKNWGEWYIKNKEDHCAKVKKWRSENIEKHNETHRNYNKLRKETDNLYKFCSNVRTLIHSSFTRNNKNLKKRIKTEKIIGCSLEEFKEYILNKCPKGTTLKDFGRYGYHIDHIIPISTANTEEDIIKLCNYTNLQPLWWKDNLNKSNKIVI